jgi:hypothetical protein
MIADLIAELRARTFSRWESDVQAVMEYEDELCTRAANALEASEARATALEKALEPFAWFGEKNTDSTGWAGLRCERERINVWFGPSDFRNAFEASALSPKLGEERR